MASPRRLTVTLNTATPPSRQLLTTVRCCHCGYCHQLPLSSFNAFFHRVAEEPRQPQPTYYIPPEGEEPFSPRSSGSFASQRSSLASMRLSTEFQDPLLFSSSSTSPYQRPGADDPENRHRCGLPSDYSTPFQCMGYTTTWGSSSNSTTPSSGASSTVTSPTMQHFTVTAGGASPGGSSTGYGSLGAAMERTPCRHVYCLGCEWLVNGEFRTLHPIEIRDETDYGYASGYGDNSRQSWGSSESEQTSRRDAARGTRKERRYKRG